MRISISKLVLILTLILFPIASLQSQVTVETITVPFNASGGVSIDDTGLVYVANFGQSLSFANGSSVLRVLEDGTITVFANGFQGASGNDFDSQGNLFQSNIAGNRISKITPDGTVSTFATFGIQGPVGVAVDPHDTVYIANCGSNSIAKISPNGASEVWVSSTLFQCPNGLTMDDDGNLYTCNFGSGDIVKVTPDKQVSILATLPGGRCGHLTYFEGTLYAVARCAQQIYEISLNGDTALLAGSGARGNDDGPGHLATFNHANGIRGIRNGDNIELYINDAVSLVGNCTSVPLNPVVLRKITIGPLDPNALADPNLSTVTISDTLLQVNTTDTASIMITPLNSQSQPPSAGINEITLANSGSGAITSPAIDNLDGTYSSSLIAPPTPGYDTVQVTVNAGGDITQLNTELTVEYWLCGDVDHSMTGPDIADITALIDFLFITFTPPDIPESANMNCAGGIDIADLTALIDFLFISLTPPCCL